MAEAVGDKGKTSRYAICELIWLKTTEYISLYKRKGHLPILFLYFFSFLIVQINLCQKQSF
jgi:hypothetical protein